MPFCSIVLSQQRHQYHTISAATSAHSKGFKQRANFTTPPAGSPLHAALRDFMEQPFDLLSQPLARMEVGTSFKPCCGAMAINGYRIWQYLSVPQRKCLQPANAVSPCLLHHLRYAGLGDRCRAAHPAGQPAPLHHRRRIGRAAAGRALSSVRCCERRAGSFLDATAGPGESIEDFFSWTLQMCIT